MGNCARNIQKHPSQNDNTQTANFYKNTITAKSTANDNLDHFQDISPSKIYKRGSMRKSKSGNDVSYAIKEEQQLQYENFALARCNSEEEKCQTKKQRKNGSGQFSSTQDSTETGYQQIVFVEKNGQDDQLSTQSRKVKKYEQSFQIPRNSLILKDSTQSQDLDKNRANFYDKETPLPTVMELSIEQIDSALLKSGISRSSIKSIAKNDQMSIRPNNTKTNYYKNELNGIGVRSK